MDIKGFWANEQEKLFYTGEGLTEEEVEYNQRVLRQQKEEAVPVGSKAKNRTALDSLNSIAEDIDELAMKIATTANQNSRGMTGELYYSLIVYARLLSDIASKINQDIW